MMNSSEQIGELAAALAKAQSEIQNPAKESVNPHFKNSYADIASGLNAVRPALSKHALAVVQVTRMDQDLLVLDTKIIHSSGQWIGSTYPVCKFPVAQQQMGSALTYSRRYALFAMVGIAGEDDDDGNEASKDKVPLRTHKPAPTRRSELDENPFPGDEPSFQPGPDDPTQQNIKTYISMFKEDLSHAQSVNDVRPMWAAGEYAREKLGIVKGSTVYTELYGLWMERGKQLAAQTHVMQAAE
jgi:hypothetical protein